MEGRTEGTKRKATSILDEEAEKLASGKPGFWTIIHSHGPTSAPNDPVRTTFDIGITRRSSEGRERALVVDVHGPSVAIPVSVSVSVSPRPSAPAAPTTPAPPALSALGPVSASAPAPARGPLEPRVDLDEDLFFFLGARLGSRRLGLSTHPINQSVNDAFLFSRKRAGGDAPCRQSTPQRPRPSSERPPRPSRRPPRPHSPCASRAWARCRAGSRSSA